MHLNRSGIRVLIVGLIIILSQAMVAQINMEDSTVQVIGYWDMNEKQTYTITDEKFKISGSDTTASEFLKYSVDISIVDSTANSYTINWHFCDFDIQTDNPITQKIMTIAEEMNVTIKTDELGTVKEVVNWEEIRDYIYKATSMLKDEFKEIPNMEKVIGQIEAMYSSKESIESAAIKEIIQFYTFHGGKYKLGEQIRTATKTNNMYGGEPFDTELLLWLDEIDPDDNNYIIRMKQVVNSEQLTKTTFDYLTQIASTMGGPTPKWEEFPPLKNETWTASRIHGYGWVVYSVETKEISANNALSVENRIIEIQ